LFSEESFGTPGHQISEFEDAVSQNCLLETFEDSQYPIVESPSMLHTTNSEYSGTIDDFYKFLSSFDT